MRTMPLVALLCLLAGADTWAQVPAGAGNPPDAVATPHRPAPDEPIQVLVRLRSAPAWETFVQHGGASRRAQALAVARQRIDEIAAEQARFTRGLAALGARPFRQLQVIDNIVAVELPAGRVKELGALPGVVAIAPNRRYERSGTTSMPLLRSTGAWAGAWHGATSLTGRGVTIAVIDDGIDYTHLHFGGNGDYAGNDRTVAGDAAWPPAALPVNPGDQLVIGGYDLVGDAYSAGLPRQPDDDPAGCTFSHGTHVAGTAAGYGVTAAGTTFTGDLTPGDSLFSAFPLPSLADFRIGPGAAPYANLVALRVFGCSGSTGTDVLLDAMELALTGTWLGEDVDVVNMSLGSAFGGTGADDFLNAAQQALTASGIVVVASAGNSGNIQLITGAPGTARGTISVAGTTDSGQVWDHSFNYTDPATLQPVRIAAVRGAMYLGSYPDVLSADLALAIPANACSILAEPGPTEWDGKWLVVDRGSCNFTVKTAAVKATGAAGAIIVNNVDDSLLTMAWDSDPASALPAIYLGKTDGDAIKALLGSYAFGGTFDGSYASPIATASAPQLVYTSTSRGGVVRGNGDLILKPNIAAPGVSITSAAGGTNQYGFTISGTSMASPHIAGAAALVIDAHGRPADADGVALVKQRLMSTATRNVGGSVLAPPYQSPQRVGAGLADATAAVDTTLVAYATDAPDNVSLSFGYPLQRAGLATGMERSITVRNLGDTDVSASVAYDPASTWPGASVFVSPPTVTVPAHGTATINVALSVHATQPDLNSVGDPLFAPGAYDTFLYEVSGHVRITPTAGATTPLRVAVYAAPHLAADVQAGAQVVLPSPAGAASVALSGTGFALGADANDHNSLVSAFVLLAEDPPEEGLYWDVNGDGLQQPGEQLTDFSAADLRHVGAALHPYLGDQVLFVGLSTWGEWSSPRDVDFVVYVDVDDDGEDDYRHFVTGLSGTATDSFIVAAQVAPTYQTGLLVDFVNLAPGRTRDSMLFHNNVMSLPVYLTGLPGKQYVGGAVGLRIESYQRDSDFSVLVDEIVTSFEPGVSFTGASVGNMYPALGNTSIGFDHAFGTTGGFPSLLTLHHHNLDVESRSQVTRLVAAAQPFDLLSPADAANYPDAFGLPVFTWEAVVDATGYAVTIGALQFSGTAAVDGDAIACDGTTCTLDAGALNLPAGDTDWNVTANHPGGDLDAANGPFTFHLAADVPEAIFSDGFEQ